MKICLQSQNDGWVMDEIAKDFRKHTKHQVVSLGNNPDLIWVINPFSFPSILRSIPSSCKSVLQIHHVDTGKLSGYDFSVFNKAHCCIVPNKITESIVSRYLKIPVSILPYWLLSKTTFPRNEEKILFMKKQICPNEELLIGSFVKDGNGNVGDTPKSAKNPDLFLDIVRKLVITMKIKVLLSGYAREYVRKKLIAMKISHIYYKKYSDVNTLYDCLDWYLITSKYEGGPQSVLESSYRKVKILSTNVGMVSDVLDRDCICHNVDEFIEKIQKNVDKRENNYNKVKSYVSDIIIPKYDDYFDFVRTMK